MASGQKKAELEGVCLPAMRSALDHDRPVTVAVQPAATLAARPRLFAALQAAFPVSFEAATPSLAGAGAAIVFCEARDFPRPDELSFGNLPVLALGGGSETRRAREPVRLSDHETVDPRLRGVELMDPLDGPRLRPAGPDDCTVATSARGPVWTVTRGAPLVHRVRSSLPELRSDQALSDLLDGRAVPLVALTQFLRALTTADSFRAPPLRAVFLFDDPNLRWRTYGFIDYGRLLEHADQQGYHASMAMIPLDGGRPHRATAAMFRERPDRLSLAVHGNNHLAEELLRPTDDAGALSLAAQALRRVARFESRAGLRVDRVMAPPHGLCSESAARALGSVGFDALCAAHPLPWTHRPPASRPLAGWEPAEFVGGCAVIPRVPFDAPLSDIALRAFLGQPLVLYGHHDDIADGLGLLAETAARVNGLGDVEWTSLGNIAASNYAVRADRDVLRVRPYSRHLRLALPHDPARVVVEAPRDGKPELLGWSTNGSGPKAFRVPVPLEGREADVRLRAIDEIDPRTIPPPPWRPWPVLRRAATELRDRVHALQAISVGLLVSTQELGSIIDWL